jgi:predicted negative regulator of RcsB-dependent stress response
MSRRRLLGTALALLAGAPAPIAAVPKLPPSPAAILAASAERTPPIPLETGCRRVAARATAGRGESAELGRALQRLLQAHGASAQLRARDALRERARAALPSPLVVCSWLSLAAAELELAMFPEASASAIRAEALAAASDAPDRRREEAAFLRAEAEFQAGHFDLAGSRYRSLESSEREEIRAAITLRAADIDYHRGNFAAAFPAYRALVENFVPAAASPAVWRARAAEAAIAAGHLDLASLWLRKQIAEQRDEVARARALLRLADVRSEQHRPQDVRKALSEVYTLRRGAPEGWIALIRVYDLELEITSAEATLGALRNAVLEAGEPNVVRYAQVVLARRLVARGEFERGIRLLLSVLHDRQSPGTIAYALTELPDAIAATLERAECRQIVEVLGARQEMLFEGARSAAPYTGLGRCYEELGLPERALAIYRSATKRLGPESSAAFALPLARANLAAGRITGARIAALRATQDPGAALEWHRILAAARLASNEPETAVAGLLAYARQHGASALGAPELEILARAAARLPDSFELRTLLHARLLEIDRESAAGPPVDLGASAMLAARRWRQAGGNREASELYALAFRQLADGPLRAQAGYWAGRLGGDAAAAREQLSATRALAPAPFALLAQHELELRDLRERLGLSASGGE